MKRKITACLAAVMLLFSVAGCRQGDFEDSSSSFEQVPTAAFRLQTVWSGTDVDFVSTGFVNGYAIVAKDDLYAYMDKTGKILSDGFVYTSADVFDDESGLALVEFKDGTYAYINTDFEKVFGTGDVDTDGTQYDDIVLGNFLNGYAVVKVRVGNDWFDSVIDQKGETVIPFDKDNRYQYINNGDGTFTRCKDNDGICILDSKGRATVEFSECYAGPIGQGFVTYVVEDDEGRLLMGLMDEKGKAITEPIYYYDPQAVICNELIYLEKADSDNEGVFINSKGEEKLKISGIVSAAVYDQVIVCEKEDGLFYTYDLNGKPLSSKGFEYVAGFDGMCGVVSDSDGWSVIDAYGTVVKKGCGGNSDLRRICGEGYVFTESGDTITLYKIIAN